MIRSLSDQLKDVLTRFGEIERFIAFGADLNSESRDIYDPGLAARSLLDQSSDEYFSPIQQAMLLYLLVSKEATMWEAAQMPMIRTQLLAFMARSPYDKLMAPALLEFYDEHSLQPFKECVKGFQARPKHTQTNRQNDTTRGRDRNDQWHFAR